MSDSLITGIKHTHTLLVSIFILHLIIKSVLFLMNHSSLDNYRRKTKIALDMVIPLLFVASGVLLIVYIGMGNLGGWFHLKLTLVVIGIPLAIIGFAKKSKIMVLASLILFVYIFIMAFTKTPTLF